MKLVRQDGQLGNFYQRIRKRSGANGCLQVRASGKRGRLASGAGAGRLLRPVSVGLTLGAEADGNGAAEEEATRTAKIHQNTRTRALTSAVMGVPRMHTFGGRV
jgi:hypothetical protein